MPTSLSRSIAPTSPTPTAPSVQTHPRPATLHHLHSALLSWHLLSLDAPTVAVLWTTLFARYLALPTPLRTLPPLFLAVWILYAADRLLDARQLNTRPLHARPHPMQRPHLPASETLAPRHHFHHTHRQRFRLALLLASFLLASLIPRLPKPELRFDLLLAALLSLYFLLLHTGAARKLHLHLPKELVVGLSFAAATTIPSLAQHTELLRALLPLTLLFAALCTLNCLLIHAWEHPSRTRTRTRTQPRPPLPTPAILLALASLATVLNQHRLAPLAISLSATLLLFLDRLKHRLTPNLLRSAADLALLTPALFLLTP